MTADHAALVEAGDVWILDVDDRLVGGLMLRDSGDHLLVSNIAVIPDRQGQGLGGMLLGFAEDEARRRGFAEMRLYE